MPTAKKKPRALPVHPRLRLLAYDKQLATRCTAREYAGGDKSAAADPDVYHDTAVHRV